MIETIETTETIGIIEITEMIGMLEMIETADSNLTEISKDNLQRQRWNAISLKEKIGGSVNMNNIKDNFNAKDAERISAGSRDITSVCAKIV